MPDHRIGGVDGLVEGDAGQAEQHQPEPGRDDSVRGAFGQGLDGGAGDTGFIERLRIAADNMADGLAAGIE
ncbi:hypothetical protein D3C87_2130170 [compost metagenome]